MTNTIINLIKLTYTRISEIGTPKVLYALTQEVVDYVGPLVRVYSDKFGTEADIFATESGSIDTVALLNHTAGSFGSVAKWYDQMGNFDAVQTDQTKQPLIVDNTGSMVIENGVIAIEFDNTNDFLEATTPYSVSEPVLSLLTLFTKHVSGESDMILSTDTGEGIRINHQVSDRYGIDTKRAVTTTCQSTDITSSAQTAIIGGVADRENVKIFENGVLKNTVSDSNTDFASSTKIIISSNTGSTAFTGGKYQFVSYFLSDESDNMERYSDELLNRYDSAIPSDLKESFSDSPVLITGNGYSNGRIVGDINFTESLKVFAWSGVKQGGFGNIDLVNIDSKINYLVKKGYTIIEILTWDGTNLVLFGTGDIKSIAFIEKGRIRIQIKSVLDKLDVGLPTDRFDSTYPDLENEQKPIVLGNVNLAQPILLDVATNQYFIADALFNTTIVYDNGIQLAGGGVGFTTTSDGFTLTSNPVGRILATVQGIARPSIGYEEHISEHITQLLRDIDINFSSSDLNTIFPGITSTWWGKDETVIQAINELLDGFVSFIYAQSDGELRFGTLSLPENPTSTLIEIEVIGDVKVFNDEAKGLSNELLNSRNYNQYSDDEIAFAATQSDKIDLIKQYKRTSILSGLHPFYTDNNVKMKSQSLGGITNGEIILQYIIDLWSQLRSFYTVSTTRKYDLNEVVNFTHSMNNLENGKDLLIVTKTKSTLTDKIQYVMWG